MVGGDLCAVAGDADEAHQALFAGLDGRVDDAARAEGRVPLDRVRQVVQLPQVDAVHLQAIEGTLQLFTRFLGAALVRLGGDEEAVGIALEPGRDPELGVAIAGRDVDVVDVVLEQHVERAVGDVLRDAPERRRAEDDARALMASRQGEEDRHALTA